MNIKMKPPAVFSYILRIILLTGILVSEMAHAQIESTFNLQRVSVELMNGEVVKGELLRVTEDVLVMSDERIKLEPGCQVNFRLWGVPLDYQGKVEAVTDSTLSVRLDLNAEVNLVLRKRIERLTITSRAWGTGQPRTVDINASSIRSIQLRRKGSGAVGFVVGGLAGGFLGSALYSGTYEPPKPNVQTPTQVVNVYFEQMYVGGSYIFGGVIVGGTIGAIIATAGKKYPINGDRKEFDALVKRIYR